MTTRNPPWNDTENRALVALYFVMLDCATTGQQYNKAAMIRSAQQDPEYASSDSFAGNLSNRSRGSIEAKLMNASAAHLAIDPQDETMATHGYKAWGNYQASLKQAMQAEIYRRQVGAHNVGTCKHCGQPYRYNNMSYHDKGFCSTDCLAEAAA